MSIVIDLNLACLVCLQQDEEQMQSVYTSDEQQFLIAEKISCCSDLRLDPENSELPDKICQHCLNDLEAAWRFRQNCANANSLFQSILHQEEQAEAMANYELKQQNIKLPTGLTIKRLPMPNTKSYLIPTEMQRRMMATSAAGSSKKDLAEDEVGEIVEETFDEDEDNMHTEQLDDILEEEIDESDNERIEIEEDYYEAEQILEEGERDENEEEGEEEERLQTIEELEAIERGAAKEKQKKRSRYDELILAEQRKIKLEEVLATKIKVEQLDEDEQQEQEREQEQNIMPKRGRGRPKRNKSPHRVESKKVIVLQKPRLKINSEPENSTRKTTLTKSTISTSAKYKSKSKNYINPKSGPLKPLPVRNRKSLPADMRPPKICEICGNSYKFQHALNAHMRRHTNTRPFGCEFCEKAFVSNVELRRHMRVHTGHKPYACQYCERRFSDFGSRIKHERTHTGERPYVCSCGKSFAYAHVLSVHMRTHTGEKRFQCSHCGKGFTKKVYLETHMEQHARACVDVMEGGDQQQLLAIKTVALEECIFTTEYIGSQVKQEKLEEGEDYEHVGTKEEEQYEMSEILNAEDDITEEHLEDGSTTAEEQDFIMAVR